MRWCSNGVARFGLATLLVVGSLACHAQSVLTPAKALDFRRIADLHFSPDGSKLVFVVYSYSWDWQPRLWILDVASGNARELTPPKKSERSPQWSPDGKLLAFLSNRDGRTQVYTIHADASNATIVTSRKYGVTGFHWSPDGAKIAYLAKDDSAPASDSGPQVADRESDLPRLWITELSSGATQRIGKTGYRIDEFQWQSSSRILIGANDAPRVEEFIDAVYGISINDGTITLLSRPPQPF